MTIIIQENDIINYSAIKRISIFKGTVDSSEENIDMNVAETTFYGIIAFDFQSDFSDDIENQNDGLQIGIFDNEEECNMVMKELIKSIANGKTLFRIPQPSFESV